MKNIFTDLWEKHKKMHWLHEYVEDNGCVNQTDCYKIVEGIVKNLTISDVSGRTFLTKLLSEIKEHEREIISDPHRFDGVSTAEIERVFRKYGVKIKIPF